MRRISFIVALLLTSSLAAQDELLDLLQSETDSGENYVSATFKSTRLNNGHSIEVRPNGVLEFVISHRFGTINSGHEEFWGLDVSNIRLALEYGVTDNLNIGVGRSSFGKVLDAFMKVRMVRQSDKAPVTVTGLASIARTTAEDPRIDGIERNAYTVQFLIARKFNSKLSLQVMPTVIQRNFVETNDDDNLLIAAGIGGRYKVSNRIAIITEYYPQLSNFSEQFKNSFAIGVDIETGGHVFQLSLTNAEQMNERGFIGETQDDFFNGDIHYGFNISRVFDLKPKGK